MRLEEAYWMAAAVDGEGSVSLRNRGRNRAGVPRYQVHLVLANNDERFLRFAQDACRCGRIYGRRAKQLRIERREDVLRVLKAILPYLLIKADKARSCISALESQPPRVVLKGANGKFQACGVEQLGSSPRS
jgi:hypothetical protein